MEKYKPIAEKLAVFGCYSVAAVYIIVGVMAILSFLGKSEPAADEERMVKVIMDLPLGEVIIATIILGLLGYVTWRVFEAFADPYQFGSSLKGKAIRTGIALSALGYVIIAFGAGEMLVNGADGSSERDQQLFISRIFTIPAGEWLVGMAGVMLFLTALVQIKYIYTGDYHERMNYDQMPPWLEKATVVFAWAGYIARSIILGILGFFLVKGAIKSDSDEVGDTDSAFDFIGDFGPVGHVVFIAVALGTISYGLFMILNGIYYSFEGEKKDTH
jgi:hypothetical protein